MRVISLIDHTSPVARTTFLVERQRSSLYLLATRREATNIR